jgi:CBS domain-containing protein
MTPVERVVSVQVGATYKEVAGLLDEHRISAVPVLDESSRVLGVVSEADLLAKESVVEEEPAPRIAGTRAQAVRAKAAATTAGELMTSPAVLIGPDEDVAHAARLMRDRRVKRLPVADPEGRLLGIVSRSDVLSVFLRSDADIREEVAEDIVRGILWVDPSSLAIEVHEGVVTLAGQMSTKSFVELIGALARRADGVVDVVNNLTYEFDDSKEDVDPPKYYGILHGLRRHRG